MKTNKKGLIAVLVLLVAAIAGILWMRNNMRDYINVTEDRGNVCTYDTDGKLSSTSLAAGREVKVKIPKAEYEQYKKNAIASNKCFY